jgi:hypothetical protein
VNDEDLRDLFACCALVSIAGTNFGADQIAYKAYALADAMMVERNSEDGIVAIKPNKKPTRK